MIINYCSGGLGNRLKPLSSCGVLAEESNKELGMFWQPTMRCQTHFTDLFKNDFYQFDDTNLGELENVNIQTVGWYIDHDANLNGFNTLRGMSKRYPICDLNQQVNLNCNVIVYNNDYLPTVPLEKSRKWLKKLQPLDFIQSEIDKFCKENEISKNVIGVHVRGTDFENGNSVIQPIVSQMEQHNGRFFVCSDSLDYETALKQRFGDRVIFRKKNSYVYKNNPNAGWSNNVQTPKESVQESLIDLYILSMTDFKIYNPNSTFADVALALSSDSK